MPATEMQFKGFVEIELNGLVVMQKANLVVNAGLNLAGLRIFTNSANYIQYLGIGSGTTAPAAGQTALTAQLGARRAFDSTPTVSTTGVTVCTCLFPAGQSTGSVAEAGLFTATTGGAMFSRVTFTAIPKQATDELRVTWTITPANG